MEALLKHQDMPELQNDVLVASEEVQKVTEDVTRGLSDERRS